MNESNENKDILSLKCEKCNKLYKTERHFLKHIENCRSNINDSIIKPISKENLDQEIKNIKQKKDKRIYRKALVLYIWNRETMNCELKDLPFIEPVLELKSTSESFALVKPCLTIKGKPVFIVEKGNPISLNLKMIDNDLVEIIYSSDEINAITRSIHANRVFRQHKLLPTQIALWIISLFSSVLTTCLIYTLYISAIK